MGEKISEQHDCRLADCAGIALGAIVLARALYWAISNYVKKIAAKTESKLDDIIIDMIDEPLVVAGGAAGIWVGFTYLDFSVYASADNWVSGFFSVVFTLIAAWLITRLFDSLVDEVRRAVFVGDRDGAG